MTIQLRQPACIRMASPTNKDVTLCELAKVKTRNAIRQRDHFIEIRQFGTSTLEVAGKQAFNARIHISDSLVLDRSLLLAE